MIPVLIAQFLSALADNMLLFILLGMLKQQAVPDWVTPLLQQTFLIAYIVLAPFVGAFADGFPKGRVMLLSNTLKFLAVVLLLLGGNEFLVYGLVGVGACIYSPAKYGILKEIKGESFLVKANAMIESSTIVAILVGVVLGGVLADVAVKNGSFTQVIMIVAAVYFCASLSNLWIPKLPALKSGAVHLGDLVGQFVRDFRILVADFPARLTLIGTGLFFGVGATMRFLLIAWVPLALNITDNKTPAMLNAIVAIGIVIGAGVASRIPLHRAHRVLSAGIAMGLCVVLLSLSDSLTMAYVWLVAAGISGGIFLVPLNALLQRQGHDLVGGGHAIAIQNFVENVMMLLMLGIYAGLSKTGFSAITVGVVFGALVVLLMLALRLYSRR